MVALTGCGTMRSIPPKIILIVEDEPLVRELSVGHLVDAGFDVREAPTADEALSVLNSGAAIVLVFTDVNMPGELDGLQLAAMVRERWPKIRVLVTSGGGQVGPALVSPPAEFMAKPYALHEMVAAVTRLTGPPAFVVPVVSPERSA